MRDAAKSVKKSDREAAKLARVEAVRKLRRKKVAR